MIAKFRGGGEKKPHIIYLILNYINWRVFIFSLKRNDKLRKDFYIWRKRHKLIDIQEYHSFVNLWIRFPEFKSLCHYRYNQKIRIISRIFNKGVKNLYLNTPNIGGGMLIEHGFSSIIVANSIGNNFMFHQNCTVGYNHGGKPTIGNNVKLYAGSVIAGPINIGNNVTIGANCVVLKDVPDNCVCYGNPCQIKSKND